MAGKHPYISGSGAITAAITQFRKALPATIDADTLKRLGLAPSNESYLLSILGYIGVIDGERKRTEEAQRVFSQHNDEKFAAEFSEMIKSGYDDIFSLHGEGAWNLDRDQLITFFRQADQTSGVIGQRQAGTFIALAEISGKRESGGGERKVATTPAPRARVGRGASRRTAEPKQSVKEPAETASRRGGQKIVNQERLGGVGLTVRVEVNLPANADQKTYDNIFASIKKNLLS